MNNQQKSTPKQLFKNKKCKLADHQEQQINIICVNERCEKIRLGCPDCALEYHFDHPDDILDFKQFEIWRTESLLITEYVTSVIKEMEQTILNLQQFVKQCTYDICCNIDILTKDEITYSVQNLLLYRAMSRFIKSDIENLYSHLQKMKNKLSEVKQMSCIQLYHLANKNLLKKPEEIVIYLDWKLKYQISDVQFKFSQQHKNSNIELSEGLKCAEIGSRQWGFCICEPILPKQGSIVFSCKQVKLGYGLVHIGLSIKEQINYDPVLYKVGHGLYLIDSNGLTYSHHEKQKNCEAGSFKFTDGDIINVQIDQRKQEISWKKKDSQEKFTIDFSFSHTIFPCVGLGDSAKVQIINY